MNLFKRILAGLVILTIVGCSNGSNLPVRSPSSLVSHMDRSTVALVIRTDEGLSRVYCTGVWVSADVVLTANHCVAAAARMNSKSEDEDDDTLDLVDTPISYIVESEVTGFMEEPSAVHLAKVLASDPDHDLALVRALPGGLPGHAVAELVSEMPGIGDHVYIVGHVKGLWWSHIEGVVSKYRKSLDFVGKSGPFVQISGPVYFGNSGGGAFDSSGNLVGICSFMALAPQTNFFIHADSIKKFMKNNL